MVLHPSQYYHRLITTSYYLTDFYYLLTTYYTLRTTYFVPRTSQVTLPMLEAQ